MPEPVVARIHRGGRRFEILVNSDKAYAFREGKRVNVSEILIIDKVFSDARKGLEVSSQDLEKAFGTADILKIAEVILREGEIQITAEYRKKLQEEKFRWLVNYIHRNFVDPQTGLPHPPSRIERAMRQAKVRVDPFKEPEAQVKEVVEKLRRILPLKSGRVKLAVTVPAPSYGKVRSLLAGHGDIISESWSSDGSKVTITVRVPLGSQVLILDRVGRLGGEVKALGEE